MYCTKIKVFFFHGKENIFGQSENNDQKYFLIFSKWKTTTYLFGKERAIPYTVNPLPDTAILAVQIQPQIKIWCQNTDKWGYSYPIQ